MQIMRTIFVCIVFMGIEYNLYSNFSIYFFSDSNKISAGKDTLVKSKKDSLTVSKVKDTLVEKIISVPIKDTLKNEIPKIQISNYDKIMKKSGDSIMCTITNKNLYEVEYTKPNSKTKIKLSTANIKEIYYANGKYDLIDNTPEKKQKDWTVVSSEVDWKNVIITYKQSDVEGLVEKGPIDAYFEAKKMNTDNESLERNAYAILKKKAYSLKATKVLITDKKFNRMYSELPSINVNAIAYGKE